MQKANITELLANIDRDVAEEVRNPKPEPVEDLVNHPKHYTSHPSGIECIEVVEHMTFNIGNAIKYMWRSGLKDGAPHMRDLGKARWYIDREIQRLSK